MAKREENIKKINDELEKLSDEELDKVAGGEILRGLVFYQKKEQDGNCQNQRKYISCPH